MKITYTQFVPDPALRGTTTNLPAHIAQVLIASGQASAVPMPVRGTKEWLKARLEQSAQAGPPDAHDVVPPFVVGVQWEAKQLPTGLVVILRKSGGEVTRFDDLKECPACPKSVRKQFEELKAINVGADAQALDAAKRQQTEYDEKVRHAKRW
ncbi:MAG TPA: hypothetical protein VNX26_02335 [Candidatus Acidoferrum sp.]|jgi:hypothetical protein|nr:hypothetical protein [Candidatus Acidoferrum sp.]